MKLSTWHSNPDRPRRYHKPPILLRLEKSRGESQAADDGKNSPKGKIWHFRARNASGGSAAAHGFARSRRRAFLATGREPQTSEATWRELQTSEATG